MPSCVGTATGGGLLLTELPGRFTDRGGGAGLALVDLGGRSLVLPLVHGLIGDALGGGDRVRRGTGEANATLRVAGADIGGVWFADVGVRDRGIGGTGGVLDMGVSS